MKNDCSTAGAQKLWWRLWRLDRKQCQNASVQNKTSSSIERLILTVCNIVNYIQHAKRRCTVLPCASIAVSIVECDWWHQLPTVHLIIVVHFAIECAVHLTSSSQRVFDKQPYSVEVKCLSAFRVWPQCSIFRLCILPPTGETSIQLFCNKKVERQKTLKQQRGQLYMETACLWTVALEPS